MENDRQLPVLLSLHLSFAVPLKIGELEAQRPEKRLSLEDDVPCEWCGPGLLDLIPQSTRTERRLCKMCGGNGALPRKRRNGQLIAERGDLILYRSKKKGETAKLVNILVESLAMLAFYPGGVRLGSLHFAAQPTWPTPDVSDLANAMSRTFTRRVRRVIDKP